MDEVRTQDDERLDRDDFEGVQDVVYDAMRVLAGGMSGKGGTLAGMDFDTGTLSNITIGEGIIALATINAADKARLARVIHHDPTATWQSGLSSINLTGVEPATPWIWARRELVDHDQGSRREWDPLLGDEAAITPYTRRRSRVVFGFGSTEPDANEGWTIIAKINSWSGGSPIIRKAHAWDIFYTGGSGENQAVSYVFNHESVAGLAQVLSYIVYQLGLALSGGADPWTSPPAVSLKDIDTRIDNIEDYHDEDTVFGGVKVLWASQVKYLGPTYADFELDETASPPRFGGDPAWAVPAPQAVYGEFFQTFRVSGKVKYVFVTHLGNALDDPMIFRVGTIGYDSDGDGTWSQFSVWGADDAGATAYGSYYIMAVGAPK